MKKTTIALAALAALRTTRFVTRDTLGSWLILDPAERWALQHDGGVLADTGGLYSPKSITPGTEALFYVDPDLGWRSKLVSGLSCPHCVGFWITSASLAAGAIAERNSTSKRVFNFVAGSLGLSYAVSHISQRLDN